jgi:phosphate transport system permease protein
MRSLEWIAWGVTRGIAVVTLGIFLGVIGYILVGGTAAFSSALIAPGGRLWAPMVGTIMLVVFSSALALPIGVGAGVYLGVYARGGRKRRLSYLFELLASIPSIVIGLFGFSLILMLHRWWGGALPSLLLAAGSVAILILPYLIKATELGITEAPKEPITIAYALGATTEQVVWRILLPAARTHILKGSLLATARAAEDTAVIMLTGAVASFGVPRSVFEPFEALPFYIYTTTAEYGSQAELETIFVAAMVLIALAGVLVLMAGAISLKESR